MTFDEKNAMIRGQILRHFDLLPPKIGPDMNDWAQRLQGFVSRGSSIERKYRKRIERKRTLEGRKKSEAK